MSKNLKILLLSIFTFVLFSAYKQDKTITIYLVGDSTMADKDSTKYPETGWGTPFKWFFSKNIEIENHARNGKSTKSFLNEGRWDKIKETLKEGDYVFIQFGHNDEIPTKKSATTPEEFKANLIRYINETRQLKATPILLTSVARRSFENDILIDTHEQYANITKEVAKTTNTSLIDVSQSSMQLLSQLGSERSKDLFLQLAPLQNPNYPKGVIDNTHFNEFGARRIAELIVNELKTLDIPLKDFIGYK